MSLCQGNEEQKHSGKNRQFLTDFSTSTRQQSLQAFGKKWKI